MQECSNLAKTSQSSELKKALDEAEKFLKNFRRHTVVLEKRVGSSEISEAECDKEITGLKGWVDSAQVHLDGTTAFLKRARGWLS